MSCSRGAPAWAPLSAPLRKHSLGGGIHMVTVFGIVLCFILSLVIS